MIYAHTLQIKPDTVVSARIGKYMQDLLIRAQPQALLRHLDGSAPRTGQVFVFGSNLAGRHGLGAAKFAREYLGVPGGTANAVGWLGRNRSSYGIATKDAFLGVLGLEDIAVQVTVFLRIAEAASDREFFLTRVGCGLAGYADEDIAPLFNPLPPNCSITTRWARLLPARGAALIESDDQLRVSALAFAQKHLTDPAAQRAYIEQLDEALGAEGARRQPAWADRQH
jgi:hypothetical protein